MVETLIDLDVPTEDAAPLGEKPRKFLANRISTERENLGLSPVPPLIHFKLPPPPPAWLTPAVIAQMFDLALQYQDERGESEDFPSSI